jgi:RNA polymerase primary sigma factor
MLSSLRDAEVSVTKRNSLQDDPNAVRYFRDVSKMEVLDAKTEHGLFIRYRDLKDIPARDRIIGSALRFVVKLAKGYARDSSITKDLISAGNVGLLRALERYDPDVGTRFLSYATSWVLLEMRNELYNSGLVSVPLWRQKAASKIQEINDRAVTRHRRKATMGELQKDVDLTSTQIEKICETPTVRVVYTQDYRRQFFDSRGNLDIHAMNNECRQQLLQLIKEESVLPTVTDKFTIKAYFGLVTDPLSLRQIANVIGVSSERVRQVRDKALARLHKAFLSRLNVRHIADLKECDYGVKPSKLRAEA